VVTQKYFFLLEKQGFLALCWLFFCRKYYSPSLPAIWRKNS